MPEPTEPDPRRRRRTTILGLMALVAFAALGLGWWRAREVAREKAFRWWKDAFPARGPAVPDPPPPK